MTTQTQKQFRRYIGSYGRIGLKSDAPRFFGICAYYGKPINEPDHRFPTQFSQN